MTDNTGINELEPVPEFVILRFAFRHLQNTLSQFSEPGWSIAENPVEVYRASNNASYQGVLKHDESGRHFQVSWIHTFFRDEMRAFESKLEDEVFPVEVRVTKFMSKAEAEAHQKAEQDNA